MPAPRKLSKRQREAVAAVVLELLELAEVETFEIVLVPCAEETIGVTLKDRWVQEPLRVDRQGRVLYPQGMLWAPREHARSQLAIGV
jgi:hypothetical protein